jgi:uncharacterized protein
MSEKEIAILYHGGCPDGFGGAYAAWKKLGEVAEYIPVQHGKPAPEHLEGKDLYLIDFCYPEPIMLELEKTAKSITVLDHHEGARAVATQFPGVFDTKRSGATIAWSYFHPDVPVPLLLEYVEDGDLYVFKLPSSRAMLAYMYAQPFHFEMWDTLREQLETTAGQAMIVERGKVYAEHFHILVEQIAQKATLVSFEGYECYLATAPHMFVSDVGNYLANTRPPLALITNFRGDVLTVSLRSDPSIDVSAIARKYGGNGHPQASAFRLNWGDPLPWTVIKEHEDSRG